MMRIRYLSLCVLLVACSSIPQAGRVPIMGIEPESDAAAAASAGADTTVHTVPVPADSVDLLAQSLLFLPFRDLSGYEGSWPVWTALPTAVADALGENDFLRPIPVDSVWARLGKRERKGRISLERGISLARTLGADYVIFGDIEALSMSRFRATVPVGGYRSYEGVTRITLRPVKVIDQEPLGNITRDGIEATKQYGITNPASYVPYEKEYFMLGHIAWGSPEFQETLVGKSVDKCMIHLVAALDSLILPPREFAGLEPLIIDVNDAQAYINVGLVDSVRNGDKFGVWDRGRVLTDPQNGMVLGRALPQRVGVVQVEQVLSAHLSLVRILEGRERVRREYSIRAE